MLHARHHLLSDVAAFVEIDAIQAVHVGLVRKRIAIHEVEPAAGYARSDTMGLIDRAIHQIRIAQVGDLLLKPLRRENAPTERGVTRIGERQIWLHRWFAVPRRE